MTEKRHQTGNELYIAYTLVDDHVSEFGVRVLNPTKAPIRLTAGEKLCSVSLVTDIAASIKPID